MTARELRDTHAHLPPAIAPGNEQRTTIAIVAQAPRDVSFCLETINNVKSVTIEPVQVINLLNSSH